MALSLFDSLTKVNEPKGSISETYTHLLTSHLCKFPLCWKLEEGHGAYFWLYLGNSPTICSVDADYSPSYWPTQILIIHFCTVLAYVAIHAAIDVINHMALQFVSCGLVPSFKRYCEGVVLTLTGVFGKNLVADPRHFDFLILCISPAILWFLFVNCISPISRVLHAPFIG